MTFADIFSKIDNDTPLTQHEVVTLLAASPEAAPQIFTKADQIRATHMGDEIYLRGIIEFSNYCKRNCNYCGIRRGTADQLRYRIPDDEILETCKWMESMHMGTVVLQSGEDAYYTRERLGALITRIKTETSLAITLSVGEADEATYRYWQGCGMDRYLLRFETSNRDLFAAAHPDDDFDERLACLAALKRLGVQTGSGLLIGLPDETLAQLADDILFCTRLGLDMIGCGPFIPNAKTPFDGLSNPFDTEVFFKTIAILRLLNKKSHIPATTAFDAIDKNGRNRLLTIGANIFMPNATPQKYREHYQLYPNKPCVNESSGDCACCTQNRILNIGRKLGTGPGHSLVKDID